MNPKLLVYILTNVASSFGVYRLVVAYENNNYLVDVFDIEELQLTGIVANLLIVDLDTLIIKDTEGFKELISEKATRILILCSTSFQRLLYYNDFDIYTSIENLLEREFFAYAS